jgi:pimeloyl-ACP methyl ester carboxylesterase
MAFADLGDVQLFFTDEGTGGPPMLFVHGYTCDSHDWSWQLPHFAAKHRVIALDLRGHGRSSTPESGYEPLVFAADVARLVERLGCPPVVAVGHSMGALVVSALAVEHPEMVQALVTVDPGYLVADATVDGIPALRAAMEASDPVPFVQGLLGASDTRASVPALRAWHLRRVAGIHPHVLRETLTNMSAGAEVTAMRSGSERYLRRRRCPVLSFYADASRVSVETTLFADARSKAVSWEGCGHWLHQERAAEFNALVDTWLESISSSPDGAGLPPAPGARDTS